MAVLAVVVAGAAAWFGGSAGPWGKSDSGLPRSRVPGRGTPAETGGSTVGSLFKAGRSDVVVTFVGRVVRTLADDNDGDRHQKFLVEADGGITVLIAHNIDLAARVPAGVGDAVTVRGEYEWTDKGGTVHWTHKDPRSRHADGWIEHGGRRYE